MTTINLATATDTYKIGHHSQYPEGTTGVYLYGEARRGSKYDNMMFMGLQPILQLLEQGVTKRDVDRAEAISYAIHGKDVFHRERWDYILDKHNGRFPLRIKAVAEGTVVPVSNAMFTIENTDPKAYWLPGHFESLIMHVWHTSTVATVSFTAKQIIKQYLDATTDDDVIDAVLPFMLHDFGYRGATSHESAAQAGAAHLVNFLGSDTIAGVEFLIEHYIDAHRADLKYTDPDKYVGIAYSVVASEHSTMTALGKAGERKQVQKLLTDNPTGIVSCVGDSYNILRHVDELGTHFKPQILARHKADEFGMTKWVVRPDSLTDEFRTKGALNVELLERLGRYFGYTVNTKGYKVLHPAVGLIDGDGNTIESIADTLEAMQRAGWAASNIVFGMGGGLHQAGIDRDTQRFAIKSSAQQRSSGAWTSIQKNPLDQSKKSKAGRLALVAGSTGVPVTVPEGHEGEDLLRLVFENGVAVNTQSLTEIRAVASAAF